MGVRCCNRLTKRTIRQSRRKLNNDSEETDRVWSSFEFRSSLVLFSMIAHRCRRALSLPCFIWHDITLSESSPCEPCRSDQSNQGSTIRILTESMIPFAHNGVVCNMVQIIQSSQKLSKRPWPFIVPEQGKVLSVICRTPAETIMLSFTVRGETIFYGKRH